MAALVSRSPKSQTNFVAARCTSLPLLSVALSSNRILFVSVRFIVAIVYSLCGTPTAPGNFVFANRTVAAARRLQARYLIQTKYTSPCNNPDCLLNILTVSVNYVLLLKWLFGGFLSQTGWSRFSFLYVKPVTGKLALWKASLRKPQFTFPNIITPFFRIRVLSTAIE